VTRRLTSLLLVLALAATACGGSPDPQELIDAASERLEDAGTSRFDMAVDADGTTAGRYTAEGEQDLETGVLRMTIDLGEAAPPTETLLGTDEVFVRGPLLALFTGDESVWVRVDLEEPDGDDALDAEALVGSQTGPAALLAQLEGAADDLEELGTEEVRGVETTHLRVTVDTDAAIERSDPAVRDRLREYAEATELPSTYPMELWIDDDGLVRRIRTVLDVPVAEGDDQEVTQETVLELYDFGVEVDLTPPGEDETVDLSEIIADLEELERLEAELSDEAG
jgi:hypothetical protein